MAEAAPRARAIIEAATRPVMPRHIKLRHDEGRGRWIILAPERLFDPDEVAVEVLKLCDRTGFRFYEPRAEIILGKAYLAEKDFEKAEGFAQSAYDKAVGMKYRWAEGDAGHLLGEVYLAKGDKVKARKQLEKAVKCRKEISDPNVEETEKLLERLG